MNFSAMSAFDSALIVGQTFCLPLLRLLAGLAMGLLLVSVLESLRWTHFLVRPVKPLTRLAHLSESSSAAFALAFVSPAAANSLLARAHNAQAISGGELILANLFNSLPAYLIHTPAIFLLAWPVLGWPAVVYVGLSLLAATARTGFTVVLAAMLLPPVGIPTKTSLPSRMAAPKKDRAVLREALDKARQRFVRRLPRLVFVTVPIYGIMYVLQRLGQFELLQAWLATHMDWLGLKPEAMGVIALHLAAEFGAALGAADFALQSGALSQRDIVLALLVGNILSTPVRAIRHQLPAYSGFFRPSLALQLILTNQGLRAASMALMTVVYYYSTV